MDSMLSEVARMVADTIPPHLTISVNVIYFPQLGYLIVVPLNESGQPMYDGYAAPDDAWNWMFSSETSAYYKNTKMSEIDDHFGDMYSDICGMSSEH
jgi:DNA mismatch repair protein MSH5